MRRWLPIALLIALAGLVWLFLVRGSHPTTPASAAQAEPRSQDPGELKAAEPALQAESKDPRAQLAPDAAVPVAEPATQANADPTVAHLTIHFVGKTSREPVSKVRVMLSPATRAPDLEGRLETKNVDAPTGDLRHFPVTGADGLVSFDLPPGRDFRIWARNEAEQSDDASAEIPRLRASEQRELVLEVADGIDGHVFGRVVSTETGESVAGAHVFVEKTGAGMSTTIGGRPVLNRGRPAAGGLVTGNDGAFELTCSLWEHPRIRVETDGYGMRYVDLDGLHADTAHALVVRVSRAATLSARLLDASGTPIPEASVELSTKGFMLSFSEADEQGFFSSQGFRNFPPDESWNTRTGADGRARIEGLPPRATISLKVEKQGKLLHREAAGLVLQPGEVKELEWRIGSGTLVHGLALDQDGKPVSGLEIWAANASSDRRRNFMPSERDEVPLKARTDSEGRFTLEDLAAGRWWIGPGAERGQSVAPVAEVVELANEPTRELTIHVFRDLYIRGRVLSPTGEPVRSARVWGLGAEGQYIEGVDSGGDGTFDFGPVASGPISLTAESPGSMSRCASSLPVQATAGETCVTLQLRLGGAIRGRVHDEVTGIGCAAQLFFAMEQGAAGGGMYANGMQTNTQPDGSFSREGFEAGKWSVTATTADGKFAQQAHIEVGPDSDSGELVFALSPGGKLRFDYKGAQPEMLVSICSQGSLVQFQSGIRSGKASEYLAPAGSLVLEIRKSQGGPARTMTVELKAGETKEILLADED